MRTSDQYTIIEGQPRDYATDDEQPPTSVWFDVWATVVNLIVLLFH